MNQQGSILDILTGPKIGAGSRWIRLTLEVDLILGAGQFLPI